MGIEINTLSTILLTLSSLFNVQQMSLIKQLPQVPKWQYTKQQDDLILNVQAFTKKEAKSFFKEDLLAKGYRPLLIQISNMNQKDEYIFQQQNINLPRIDSTVISSYFKINIKPYIALLLLQKFWKNKLDYFLAGSGIAAIMLNQLIESTFKNLSAASIPIPPLTTINTIMFVDDNQFNAFFTINVLNPKADSLIEFNINLFEKRIHPPLFMLE